MTIAFITFQDELKIVHPNRPYCQTLVMYEIAWTMTLGFQNCDKCVRTIEIWLGPVHGIGMVYMNVAPNFVLYISVGRNNGSRSMNQ